MSFGLIGTFGSSPLCASRQAVKSCHSGAPPSVVMTVRHVRQLRLDVADLRDEFGADEQHRRLAVADDEGDLGPGEAPVHRRHHHIGLHRAHQQFEIDVAVLAEIGDALARLDAERDQRVRNAVGLDVEFGEAGLASLEFIGQRVAAAFGAVAHHVGEVRRLLRSGHVSPVASCFRCAEFGVIRRQRQYGRIGVRRMLRSALGIALRATPAIALLPRPIRRDDAAGCLRNSGRRWLCGAPRSRDDELTPSPRGPSRSAP